MVIRTKNADGGTEKRRTPMTFAAMESERTVMGMAEYIACRRCDSPDCKGCNLKRLETMLENGKFDCLMNENRASDTSAEVSPVRNGRWDYSGRYRFPGGSIAVRCSECGCALTASEYKLNKWNYCPVCGTKMDG